MSKEWDGVTERRSFPTLMCKLHDERLDRIDKAIYGNGEPTMGMLWEVKHNTEFIREVKSVWCWAFKIAMGGAMSAIGLFIIQIIKIVMEHNG